MHISNYCNFSISKTEQQYNRCDDIETVQLWHMIDPSCKGGWEWGYLALPASIVEDNKKKKEVGMTTGLANQVKQMAWVQVREWKYKVCWRRGK